MKDPSEAARLRAWRVWIGANLPSAPRREEAGAAAALEAGRLGIGRFGAAAAACRAMGLLFTPKVRAGLLREHDGLEDFVATLPLIAPANGLTAEGLDELSRILDRRLGEYRRLIGATAPGREAPAAGDGAALLPVPVRAATAPAPAGTARAVAPAGPAFSLQGFLSEHGILVISYVGAFLLIVATLLFEVYGTTGADGVVRFGAVLGLTGFFAAAGWFGLRSPRLRLVGRSYAAVAALMTPLDFAAAYSFLVLSRHGVTAAVAVTLAGASCAVLYGILAGGLRSAAYAHLSMLALAVGWSGLLTAVHAGPWSGTGFVALTLVYVMLSARPGPLARMASLWQPLAGWYVHAAAAVGVSWALVSAAGLDLRPGMLYLAVALALAAGGYVVQTLATGSRISAALAGATLLAAWAAGIVAVGITDWAGAALAPTALLVLAARSGLLGKRLAGASAPSTVAALHVVAGCSITWTVARLLADGPRAGALFTAVTFAVLACAYLGETIRGKDRLLAGAGLLSAGLALLALLFQPDLGGWRGIAFLPAAAALALLANRPRLAGATGAALAPAAEILTHVATVTAILLAADAFDGWPMTAVLASLTLLYGVEAGLPGRRWMVWVPAVGVSATVLQASLPLGLATAAVALELVLLAWGCVFASRLAPAGVIRLAMLAGGAGEALAILFLPVTPDWIDALLLLAAAGVGVAIALIERRPPWLSTATPLFTLAWFHGAAAVIPPPPSPSPDDLVKVFAALPVVYSLLGLRLRRRFGRAWTLPPHISAAIVAAGVAAGAFSVSDFLVLGWALLAYSVLAYLTAILERSALVAATAALILGGAVASLLHAAAAPAWGYSVALVVASAVFYLLPSARRQEREGSDWMLVHRAAGLGGAELTVFGTFATSAGLAHGDGQFAGGLFATLGLAALLLVDARLHRQVVLEYAAGLTAVLSVYWVDRLTGVSNPQLLLSPIGLALIAASMLAGHDGRLALDRGTLQTVTAAGLALVLGTTAVQSISEAVPWTFTAILVAEGAAAVLVGVGMRNRVMVICGGAAVALASLRALVLIEQQYPLYVVFGGVALLLLLVAGALSIMRDRIAAARGSLGRSWQEWD